MRKRSNNDNKKCTIINNSCCPCKSGDNGSSTPGLTLEQIGPICVPTNTIPFSATLVSLGLPPNGNFHIINVGINASSGGSSLGTNNNNIVEITPGGDQIEIYFNPIPALLDDRIYVWILDKNTQTIYVITFYFQESCNT